MSADRWKKASRVAWFLVALGIVGAGLPWLWCGYSIADGMTREVHPVEEAELVKQIETALEPVGGEENAPAAFGARIDLARPVCLAAHPWTDALPGLAIFGLAMIFGFFARNQADYERAPEITDDRIRRVKQDTSQIQRETVPTPARDAIDVGGALDLGDDRETGLDEGSDTLMDYVQESVQKEASRPAGRREAVTVDGFFCPKKFAETPSIYVDPSSEDASDARTGEAPLDNPERPFETIGAALHYASENIRGDAPGMQVRVMPGVYQEAIRIPDRVAVVNHRTPAEGTVRQRLKWLLDQDVDHPECVTIHPPSDADIAVELAAGRLAGIVGCHLAGRADVSQVGIRGEGAMATSIVHCHFEGFRRGGIRLHNCGTEIAGHGTEIVGCRFLKNESKHGGALHATASVVSIEGCIFERNRGYSGGAIFVEDLKTPMMVKTSRFAKNRAQKKAVLPAEIDTITFDDWRETEGMGGALFVKDCNAKVVDVEFVENGASAGGGGIGVECGRVLLDATRHGCRFSRNKGRCGGAILGVGFPSGESVVKAEDVQFDRNSATHAGGAVALVGVTRAQFAECEFQKNEASEATSLGGGLAAYNGAEFIGVHTSFFNNKAGFFGGGLAAINATLRFKDRCRIQANAARRAGGGIFCVTKSNDEMEEVTEAKAISLPFILDLDIVTIEKNASSGHGGGVRTGNFSDEATFPMRILFGERVNIWENKTKEDDRSGDDLFVEWAGEVRATIDDHPDDELLLE